MELLCLAVLFVLSGYVSWAVCKALRRAAMLGGEENGEEVDSAGDGKAGQLRESDPQENRGGEEAENMKKIARRRKKRR